MTTVSWSPSGQLLVSGSPADSNLMVGFTVLISKLLTLIYSLFAENKLSLPGSTGVSPDIINWMVVEKIMLKKHCD